jgi:serine/threonine protein kinase
MARYGVLSVQHHLFRPQPPPNTLYRRLLLVTEPKIYLFELQVDIWALGISAIEMAETIPPRWTVHPMRVIFLISREDPPRLADWDKWSLNFHDFVRMCLLKVVTPSVSV